MARLLVALCLLGSCSTPETLTPIAAHEGEDITLLRVGDGDFAAGETVTFEALVPPGVHADDLVWEVSNGHLEGRGLRVRWTLPRQPGRHRIQATAGHGGQPILGGFTLGTVEPRIYVSSAQGEIVSGTFGDVGDSCRLLFDGNTPHILYRHAEHGSLHLAIWNGASWDLEFVDGPGFGVGSTMSERFDFAMDSNGDHHIAYSWEDSQYIGYDWEVWWASDAGGSWTRERVSTADASPNSWPSIALDPLNSERPTVVWTRETSYDTTTVRYRTGADTWTTSAYGENGYSQDHTGAAEFSADGVLHVTKGLDSYGYLTWTSGTSTWSSNRWIGVSEDSNYRYRAALALDDADQPVYMHSEGISHYSPGLTHSEIELVELDYFDLAWGGGKPHVAINHDANLELVTTDSDGYWVYTVVATGVDDSYISVAVDADGDPHACYQKGGSLYYY